MRRIDRGTQPTALFLDIAVGRASRTKHRLHFARVQPDTAHAMIPRVGDVKHVVVDRQSLRQLKSAGSQLAIPTAGRARAELPQHAAIMAAFKDAVMTGVAD